MITILKKITITLTTKTMIKMKTRIITKKRKII